MLEQSEHEIKLTQDEIDYIWGLTAMDVSRIKYQLPEKQQPRALKIRHSVRKKLFEIIKQMPPRI